MQRPKFVDNTIYIVETRRDEQFRTQTMTNKTRRKEVHRASAGKLRRLKLTGPCGTRNNDVKVGNFMLQTQVPNSSRPKTVYPARNFVLLEGTKHKLFSYFEWTLSQIAGKAESSLCVLSRKGVLSACR